MTIYLLNMTYISMFLKRSGGSVKCGESGELYTKPIFVTQTYINNMCDHVYAIY